MPISTGCIKKYELVKYKGRFLIRYPSRKNPNELRKFIDCVKLVSALDEYVEVHKFLKVNTLYKLNILLTKLIPTNNLINNKSINLINPFLL